VSDSDFTKAKLWIFGTLSGILATITGWLAIQLYNNSISNTEIFRIKLEQIQQQQNELNNKTELLFEKVKEFDKKTEGIQSEFKNEIEDLKDTDNIFWSILIKDPLLEKKHKRK
jgi:uncharacterized protein YlxW (UPF0749 family)